MVNLSKSIKGTNLHHAYCILGDSICVVNELHKILEKELDFSIKNNPDFWHGEFDVMDVEDSRSIKELHQNKPTGGDKKIFVISANFITEKAQNAMLKLFEEPRGDTHFFLVLPSLNNILPTLRSRFFIINKNETGSSIIDARKFLEMPIGKKMEIVKAICESVSDEEESKIEMVKFINSIEKELKKKVNFKKGTNDEIKIFEEIEKIRQYANDQSPSLKMLLEYISLIIPVFK